MNAASSAPTALSNRDARRLLLHLQGFSTPRSRRLKGNELYRLIHSLGYVQLDSIRVVERAHHMILFARNHHYRPSDLAHLMEDKRLLFEHWTHDASVIPVEFYPHWRYRFKLERKSGRAMRTRASKQVMARAQHVLRRIKKEGALRARDFKDGTRPRGSGGWWEWGPSKEALNYLWRTGRLAVSARESFQKRYDLVERVLPPRYLDGGNAPDDKATIAWKCAGALERLGFASAREIADFWGSVPVPDVRAWINKNLGNGLREITVAGARGRKPRTLVAREDIFERAKAAGKAPSGLRIISPFDPLIRNRERTSHLFDFDYRIEVFVPQRLRRYGYYIFPILEGSRFIGRAEIIARREEGILCMERLWLEPGVALSERLRQRLEAELSRLARLSDCDGIKCDAALRRAINT